MSKGLLIAAFDFSTAAADEFHDWYDLEHVPERRAVPGFNSCDRWIGADQPTYSVATYDLESLDVLRSAPYKAIAYDNLSVWSKRVTGKCKRLLRFEGTQTTPGNKPSPAGAGAMLLNAMNVTPEAEAEFNKWYDEEHIPALSKVPGTLAARRFKASGDTGGTHRYVAIYHFTSPDVPKGQAWKTAANTPWTEKMRPHFRDHLRFECRRYTRAQ